MRRSASSSAVEASSASSGSSTEPLELEIENALPASDRAAEPIATTPSPLGAVERRQHAELVAAEPVGGAGRLHRGGEVLSQPPQQRITGGMPEAVVVGLEPVEVEQRERVRAAALDRLLEVEHQAPPVAEPGDGIRLRLAPADGQQREVVGEQQRHPHDHHAERRGREAGREPVHRRELVVDLEAHRHRREEGRDREQPAALEPERAGAGGRDPGGERQQQGGQQPQRVDGRVLECAAGGVAIQVDAVRDRVHAQSERDQDEAAARGASRSARPPRSRSRPAAGRRADRRHWWPRPRRRPAWRARSRGYRTAAPTAAIASAPIAPSSHRLAWKRGTRARTSNTIPAYAAGNSIRRAASASDG